MEHEISENRVQLNKQDAVLLTRGEVIQSLQHKVGILETKQSISEKNIQETLQRIESDVKDLKREVGKKI